jgi:catechol 2,3-dioxygenase-like lactoylglutathione lyase family enzyme
VIDHFSFQCADLDASARFYDTVLGTLGARRIMDFDEVIGYGIDGPDFWIGRWRTGDGFRESHIAFAAPDRASVDAFFAAATAEGAEALHRPRVWPEYHEHYYGAFVRDPDGNNVEAVCHLPPDATPANG